MTTNEIVEKLRKGEDVGFVDLPRMYKVAEKLGADTSMAKRLRGRGTQSDVLIKAIEKKLKEDDPSWKISE